MYIDGVIVFSLLMILIILIMMAYLGLYFYRHIKIDSKKADKEYEKSKNYKPSAQD